MITNKVVTKLSHISLLTDGIYPFVMGGMQKHSYYLAKYFALHHIHVDLYHYIPQSKHEVADAFTEEERNYIQLIPIEMPTSDKLPGHYLRQSKKYSKKIFQAFIQRKKTQFIYAQGFTAWYFLQNKKMVEVPIGLNFHGVEPLQQTADSRSFLQKLLLKPFMVKQLKNSDYVFSLGKNLSALMIQAGVNAERIIQIQIGIESTWLVEKIKPTEFPIKFLFIGRNERRKAVHELSQAIQLSNSPLIEFHFIGPLTNHDLHLSAEQRVHHQNIYMHGSITDQEKIKALVRKCDVLICASYSEGMPTVILEAMSSGLTVLATNVGAVNELVNEDTGWIIQSPIPNDIATSIKQIVSTPASTIDKKKTSAQSWVRTQFLWETVIQKTIDEIEKRI